MEIVAIVLYSNGETGKITGNSFEELDYHIHTMKEFGDSGLKIEKVIDNTPTPLIEFLNKLEKKK